MTPAPQDRPDAHELLYAVARWLMEDVRPSVGRDQRFNVLVAANSCAIVAREWEAEVGPRERSAQAALAEEIRAGRWDERWEEVIARVREEVREKLDVAHPGYGDFTDDGWG